MALAFVSPVARCALCALALLACGRIDLGSHGMPDEAAGSSSTERPTPPPQISIGDVVRTEIIPGNSGPGSPANAGEDPVPDDFGADGASVADAGGAPDAGSASPTAPGVGGVPGPSADAGAADGGSCDPAPGCNGDSCCAPSLVPVSLI